MNKEYSGRDENCEIFFALGELARNWFVEILGKENANEAEALALRAVMKVGDAYAIGKVTDDDILRTSNAVRGIVEAVAKAHFGDSFLPFEVTEPASELYRVISSLKPIDHKLLKIICESEIMPTREELAALLGCTFGELSSACGRIRDCFECSPQVHLWLRHHGVI